MTDIVAKAFDLLRAEWAADAAHDLGHIQRVLTQARGIAAKEGAVDAEALDVACVLHDLVNLPKSHPDRAKASRLSALRAQEWLRGEGWPDDRSDIVFHAIEAHSFSAGVQPTTREARILQDADRLEALGAIGLARMFGVSGALGRALFDHDDPLAEKRPLDDLAFALDHLEVKLFKLPAMMQTETGREMAVERVAFMTGFRDQILAEISPK